MNKKLMMIAGMGLIAANAAWATITVNWVTFQGIDDPLVAGTAADLASGNLAQLIWSPDAVITPIDPNNPTTPQGGEVILQSTLSAIGFPGYITFGAADYTEAFVGVTEGTLLSGMVYTRVFNSPTPGFGTWYGEGGIDSALLDQDPIPPGPLDQSDISAGGLFTLNQQVVPEPGTLAFLGLGAVAMVVRRMRKA